MCIFYKPFTNKYTKGTVLFVDDKYSNGSCTRRYSKSENRGTGEVRIWFDAYGLVKTTAVSSYLAKQKFLEPQISFNDVDIHFKQETKFSGLYLTENVER